MRTRRAAAIAVAIGAAVALGVAVVERERGGGRSSSSYVPPPRPRSEPVLAATLSPQDCRSWLSGTMVGVCDPTTLPSVYANHELNEGGDLRIAVSGRKVRVGGNRARTQVVPEDGRGDAVPVGSTITVTGTATAGSVLYLRAATITPRLAASGEALFTHLGLEHGGTATVTSRVRGRRVVFALRRPDATTATPADATSVAGPGVAVAPPQLPPGYADTPAQAVATYVAAINAHDGDTICALLAPSARRVLTGGARTPCWYLVRGVIGADVHENSDVRFARLTARTGSTTAKTIAGRRYRGVALSLEVTYLPPAEGVHGSVRARDVVWLEEARGRWRIAKPSVALGVAMGGVADPEQTLAPPDPLAAQHEREARTRAAAEARRAAARSLVAPQRRPPQCSGPTTAARDPAGDATADRGGPPGPPGAVATLGRQADVVAASFRSAGRVACVTFTLARRAAAPVVLELEITTPAGRFDGFWVEFARDGVHAGRPQPGGLDARGVVVSVAGATVAARFRLPALLPTGARWSVYVNASGRGGMGEDKLPSARGSHAYAVDARTGKLVQLY